MFLIFGDDRLITSTDLSIGLQLQVPDWQNAQRKNFEGFRNY